MLTAAVQRYFADKEVSDLHVHEGDPVWYRESGVMKKASGAAPELVQREHFVAFFDSIRGDSGIDPAGLEEALSEKGDVDFSARYAGFGIRGNLFKSGNRKYSLVLRRLNDTIPEMEAMGLPEKVSEIITQSKGIFLVTGPTGSGKSTTLAAILDRINGTTQKHIVTIEDPVEYTLTDKFCHIDQRQIGRDATSFPLALRAALRQDPDILLIGEMRDKDTVKTALDAANTGHLVFATLHTNSARQSVERMTSFFGGDEKEWASQVISSVLLGVMSQVLVQKVNARGRVLCSELMINTPAVAQLIREGKTPQISNVMDTGRSDGQRLLNYDFVEKINAGLISAEDAIYASYDPKRLQKDLSGDY